MSGFSLIMKPDEGAIQPFMPGLEAIPLTDAFTPLDLTTEQRVVLGIGDEFGEVLIAE